MSDHKWCCVAGNFGIGNREAWRGFSSWLALGAVGQAVALQMVDAGSLIHYPALQALSKYSIVSFGCLLDLNMPCRNGLRSRWALISYWVRRRSVTGSL